MTVPFHAKAQNAAFQNLGKPPVRKIPVQAEFCQINAPPQANGRFVGTIFAEN